MLCRLRIGHTRLSHGFLMEGGPQPFCEDCLVPLTIKHVMVECPSLHALRQQFFAGSVDEGGQFLLKNLLGEDCDVNSVFSYISAAGFYDSI